MKLKNTTGNHITITSSHNILLSLYIGLGSRSLYTASCTVHMQAYLLVRYFNTLYMYLECISQGEITYQICEQSHNYYTAAQNGLDKHSLMYKGLTIALVQIYYLPQITQTLSDSIDHTSSIVQYKVLNTNDSLSCSYILYKLFWVQLPFK